MIMTYMMKQVEMIGIYSQCCIRDDGNDGEDLNIKSIVGTRDSEVYISPKINISARTLKMAMHKNPVMHCDRVVIFLHGSQKKGVFFCTIEEETHEICTVLSNTLFCLLFHYLKDQCELLY